MKKTKYLDELLQNFEKQWKMIVQQPLMIDDEICLLNSLTEDMGCCLTILENMHEELSEVHFQKEKNKILDFYINYRNKLIGVG